MPFVACHEWLCYTPGAGPGPAQNIFDICLARLDVPWYQG